MPDLTPAEELALIRAEMLRLKAREETLLLLVPDLPRRAGWPIQRIVPAEQVQPGLH